MTKILVWNLQTFGINKINNTTPGYADGYAGLNNLQTSVWRRRLVYRTLQYTQPDIIVLVEVGSGDSYPNDLATLTGGMEGCIYLLNFLRTSLVYNAGDWRLVPPLRVGRSPGSKPETVAVLYRGRSNVNGNIINRYFSGPNVWTGGYAGVSVRPAVGVPAPYPVAAMGNPDILSMLVPPMTMPRVIPPGSQHNPGLQEDRVAARTRFLEDNHGVAGGFLDFGVYRPPYMTTFVETNNAGVVQRNLSIFGVHSPAVAGDQGVFIDYLASMHDVVSARPANETRIVAGDFNLNLLDALGNDAQVYQPLTLLGYTPLLQPPGPPPANLDAYRGYFATHIRNKNYTKVSRFLWSDNANAAPYPGYNYIGSNRVANFYSIDNILVWTSAPPPNYNTTIMNHVTGTPLNGVMPAPGGAPRGSLNLPDGFTTAVAWPPAPIAPNWALGTSANLCSWANYGYILGTSDHFALYADV
ncbi:MAG: hypothetical protein IPP13_07625 [Kouleothrix sp.]|jgi:hypothetical protein|nr:hypothetical protein [Kouleothrix sp.]